MSSRLRPDQRIRKPRDFEIIVKEGRFIRGSLVNVWIYRGPEVRSEGARQMLGVIIGRKTNHRATRRNLWKRRIREVFRQNQYLMRKGFAIVIQSRRLQEIPTFKDIEKEIIGLLEKAKCLR